MAMAAGASCVIECIPPAILGGSDRFLCEPGAGRFLAQQSLCVAWEPQTFTIKQIGVTMGTGQTPPVPFSRSTTAAAAQVAQHAATGQTSEYTGWIAGLLASNATETRMWVSRDGGSWVPRSVPTLATHDAGLIPGVVVDSRGRITLLYCIQRLQLTLATWSLSADLSTWTQLANGPSSLSFGGRYQWGSTTMLRNPNTLFFGGGYLGSPATVENNDVWMYVGSDNADGSGSLGVFTLQSAAAPWSARRSPVFFMLPPPLDSVANVARLVVGYGVSYSATPFPNYIQRSDLWISPDLGLTWHVYDPAPSSVAALQVYPLGGTVGVSAASWGNVAVVLANSDPRLFAASFDGRQTSSLVLPSSSGGWNALLNPSLFGFSFQSLFFFSFTAGELELFAFDADTEKMGRSVIAHSALDAAMQIRDEAGNILQTYPSFDPSCTGCTYKLLLQQDTASFSVQAHIHYGEVYAFCDTGSGAPVTLQSNAWSPLIACLATDDVSVLVLVSAETTYRFSLSTRQLTTMTWSQGETVLGTTPPQHWISPDYGWGTFEYDVMPSPAFAVVSPQAEASEDGTSAWGVLTIKLGLMFGAINVSIDGVAQPWVNASLDATGTALPLSLRIALPPTPDPSHPPLLNNVTFSTARRSYTYRIHNPCGFLVGSVNGVPSAQASGGFSSAGIRCPARSACMPRAFSGWMCSPVLVAATTRTTNFSTGLEVEPLLLAGGAFTLAHLRPRTEVDFHTGNQRLRISYQLVASDTAFQDPSLLYVALSFSSVFAPSPNGVGSSGLCSAVAFGSNDAAARFPGPWMECPLQDGVFGSGMQFSLRTCMIEPEQCVTSRGVDFFSASPPRFTPRQLIRSPGTVSSALTGDLVAANMNEILQFDGVHDMPAEQTVVWYGPRATMQSLMDTALALHPTGYIAYDQFQSNATALRGSQSSRQLPTDGLFMCVVSPPTVVVVQTMLTCTTLPGLMLTQQRMPFLAWSGGALTLSDDTISFPVRPTLVSVHSASCRQYPLASDEPADVHVLASNGTIDCPAAGMVTLQLSGSGFALSDVVVSVAGNPCGDVAILSPTQLTCKLPAGTGRAVSVSVQSYGQLSVPAPLLSYAGPTITNITSGVCIQRNNLGDIIMLSECARQGSSGADAQRTLTLTGMNFGINAATVFVGSARCLKQTPRNSNTMFVCVLPDGKNLLQNVMLIQDGGSFSTQPHSISYAQCPQGTFDPTPYLDGLACSPCPLGTFNDGPGSTGCKPCPSDLWLQSSPGVTPSSADCQPCLPGGQCGAQLISSAADHWLTASSGMLKAHVCPAQLCVACDEGAIAAQIATLGDGSGSVSGSNSGNLTASTFVTCCAPHRNPASPLCGECIDGYVSWGGECKRCVESDGSMVFLFLLLSTLLVAWLAHSASNASVGLTSIALYMLQTTSLELGQSAVLLGWVRALNFDPSILASGSGNCPMQLNPYGQTVLAILMPFILLGELTGLAGMHAIAKRFSNPAEAAAAQAAAARGHAPFFSLPRWAARCSVRYYLNASIAVLLFTYTSVTSAVIQSLWCVRVGSSRVVFSAPSMDCDSSAYKQLLPLVVVALLTFTIGFPLIVLAGGLWRHRRQARSSGRIDSVDAACVASASSAAATSLIPLYGVFRPDAWYWSFVVLARRTIFVLLDVSLAAVPRYRSASFAFSNLVAYALSLYSAPFPSSLLNRVESGSQFSLVVLSVLITAELPDYSDAVNALLLLTVLLTIALFVMMGGLQRRAVRQAMMQSKRKEQEEREDEQDAAHDGVQLAEVHTTMQADSAAAAAAASAGPTDTADELASPSVQRANSSPRHFDLEDAQLQANPAAAAGRRGQLPRDNHHTQQVEL